MEAGKIAAFRSFDTRRRDRRDLIAVYKHPMLTTAVKAAAPAISSIAAHASGSPHGHRQRPKDFVSEIDRGAEAAIVEQSSNSYPDHRPCRGRRTKSQSRRRIRLDHRSARRHHEFPAASRSIVSIALAHKNVVQQGVIFDPVRNDLFTATRGRGAFLNDRRIRVARRQHLRDCLIGTGFPFRDGSYLDTYLQMMKAMITQTAGLRRPGAAALDLAYVAAGFYDGFWEVGLNVGRGGRPCWCWSRQANRRSWPASDYLHGGGIAAAEDICADGHHAPTAGSAHCKRERKPWYRQSVALAFI